MSVRESMPKPSSKMTCSFLLFVLYCVLEDLIERTDSLTF